ncbi:MAG: glycerophosphodiester phosphodiesterase family protein, partial [Gemmatimonadota bacterium]
RMESAEIRRLLPEVGEYAFGIGPHFSSVDADLVDAAHAAGLAVHPYTVNEVEEMRRLDELGIDGFFTDQTERALEELREKLSSDRRDPARAV